MTAPTPVLRFLPDADLSSGPFGLLGLAPGPTAPELVDPALQRQLARLARHPLGRTTEADEVRLALHVAAAQLRDARVQEELLLDLAMMRRRVAPAPAQPLTPTQPVSALPPPPERAPAPPRARSASNGLPAAFDQAALAVIVYSGGWNREAQRRLASLAHVFNADLDAVQLALVRLASRRTPAPVIGSLPMEPETPETRAQAAERKSRWLAPAVLCATLLGSAVMGAVLWRVTRAAPVTPASTLTESAPPPLAPPDAVPPSAPESPRSAAPPAPGARAPRAEARVPEPEVPEISAAVTRWAAAARPRVSAPYSDDPVAALRSAEWLARLNLAAAKLLSGDTAPLERVEERPGFAPAPGRTLDAQTSVEVDLRTMTAPAQAPDGEIAEAILLARRSPGQNIDALKRRMAPTNPLGPADCDALANAAFVGSPPEIRSVARLFIDPQVSNPFMIHALLEALPLAPARDEVSSLIEAASRRRLPRPTRDEWRVEARRALLARLAELLAAPSSETDTLAESILASWRATCGGGPVAQGSADAGADAEASAALFAWWRDRAAGAATAREARAEVDAIVRQREVERLLAQGSVQRAAIDQRASAALLGFIVARERPAVASEVARILDLAADQRAHAKHVFQQIEITERAAAALWFLRLGLDAPEGSS